MSSPGFWGICGKLNLLGKCMKTLGHPVPIVMYVIKFFLKLQRGT